MSEDDKPGNPVLRKGDDVVSPEDFIYSPLSKEELTEKMRTALKDTRFSAPVDEPSIDAFFNDPTPEEVAEAKKSLPMSSIPYGIEYWLTKDADEPAIVEEKP